MSTNSHKVYGVNWRGICFFKACGNILEGTDSVARYLGLIHDHIVNENTGLISFWMSSAVRSFSSENISAGLQFYVNNYERYRLLQQQGVLVI